MLKQDTRRIGLLSALAAAVITAASFGIYLAVSGKGAHPTAAVAAGALGFLAGLFSAMRHARRVTRRAENSVAALIEALRALHEQAQSPAGEPEALAYLPDDKQLLRQMQLVARATRRAQAERAQAGDMLNNMSEGLVALDHSLSVVMLNRSARAFFQAGEADLRGQNLLRLTHLPRVVQAAADAVDSAKSTVFDWQDAEHGLTLQCSVSPVAGLAGSADGAILLITDVTAVRRTEQIRSEFVANASHELKTPLTAIKGFVELMEVDIISRPEQVKSYLARIRKETERMIVLINDILRLSELESANADTGLSTVSMKLIAQRAAESVAVMAKERGVTVQVEGEVGTLQANPDRMMQIALNLIDNAVKYNKPGGTVTVEVAELPGEVSFCVRDTGVGIPPEAQQRIFERFYRVDKGRSRRAGGTGLGLSIVKHIAVGLYKGRVNVESAVGSGTAITVTLPAVPPEPPRE